MDETITKTPERGDFYIEDHAVLIGTFGRSAASLAGSCGLHALERAIATYGRERGRRAAMRCVADGNPLSSENYIVYGEWDDPKGLSRTEIVSISPCLRTKVTICAWCETWKRHGLLEYGKIFCSSIDQNLVHGFNPKLSLEMGKIISWGQDACEFEWSDCSFDSMERAKRMMARKKELAPRVTKDFLYHCGHLLSTFERELHLELGLLDGREIVSRAIRDYAAVFGNEKTSLVREEAGLNFMRIDS